MKGNVVRATKSVVFFNVSVECIVASIDCIDYSIYFFVLYVDFIVVSIELFVYNINFFAVNVDFVDESGMCRDANCVCFGMRMSVFDEKD